jgi:hypothetical protein
MIFCGKYEWLILSEYRKIKRINHGKNEKDKDKD